MKCIVLQTITFVFIVEVTSITGVYKVAILRGAVDGPASSLNLAFEGVDCFK